VTTLDRRSPVPLWAQLADELRRAAAEVAYAERFPTELELVDRYGVSRNTVREAMRRLRDEGLIDRQRGRGTTLVASQIEQPLAGFYSLARTIEEQGLDEHSVVVDRRVEPAGEHAGDLGLAAADEVVYVERIRFAGPEPISVDRSWLPARFAPSLLEADLTHGSLYDVLADHDGVRVNGGTERISPCLPDPGDRAALGLARGTAAFRVERLVAAGAVPVEQRVSIIRGDRYSYVARWP
jgi:GntR family transcriptional regulator